MQNGERRIHPSRFLAFLALLCGALFAAPAAAYSQTMVYLVRHAEKAAQPASDPVLTPDGQVRARALADMLAHAGVQAIITTQYTRTKLTAAPLAERLGLTPEAVGVSGGTDATRAHVASVVAAVKKHAGSVILVVGHSNTVPAIVTALGGPPLADLCDGDYDQVFMLDIPATGTPRLVRARFGAPAADAACAKMQSQ